MKIVIRTLVFHFLCIVLFALMYMFFARHFESGVENKKYSTIMDFFLLSTTIQAGVGISDLYPITFYSKIVMIIQQFLVISAHVFTLYIFTL